MRLSGEWIYRKQGWNDLPESSIRLARIGFGVADSAGSLPARARVGGVGVVRMRAGKSGAGLLKATMVIALALVVAFIVAVWAMTGKPN